MTSTAPQPIISARNVTKRFSRSVHPHDSLKSFIVNRFARRSQTVDFCALDDVSFDIGRGEFIGLVGPNGSGKSTLLKLIARIFPMSSGHIEVGGRLSALIELGAGFHREMTGRENIFLNAALLGMTTEQIEERLDYIAEYTELESFIDSPVKTYSTGMLMRLGFAICTSLKQEILLVDEVLAVGDARFVNKCLERIFELQATGVTILLVSHNLELIKWLCKRSIFLHKGKIIADGETEEVIECYTQSVPEPERHLPAM